MKRIFISKPMFNLFSVVLGGLTVILALSQLPAERMFAATSTPKETVNINVQETPAPRAPGVVSSFSPAVKRAAPSVVNVYATRTVRESPEDALMNDPVLRHFFGDHGITSQPDPHAKPRKSQSLGSGVICSADGYILTNFHVVDGAEEIKVNLPDGRKEFIAKVVGTDSQTDVAVIKIDATNLPPVVMGNSDNLQVGDVVMAVGNPFGVGQTVTMGIASAVGRGGFGVEDVEDFIQTDASINPGNSGGALIDAEGRLIGLNTAILSRTGGNQGIGFAVPINMARSVMERILQSGRVVRGYLGVGTQPLTSDLARAFNLPLDQTGALVGEVSPNSPAARAGLREGDVIAEYNGKPVTDSRQLRLLVSRSSPNAKADLKVERSGGHEQELVATLGEVPTSTKQSAVKNTANLPPTDRSDANQSSLETVEVADLNLDLRHTLEIPASVHGALVARVEPGSDVYEAGLRSGDVIMEINGRPVNDADTAIQMSHKTKGHLALLHVWNKDGGHFVAIDNRTAAK